ncbi:MAG: universal stress protein [Archaeoglobaceae archaeon]
MLQKVVDAGRLSGEGQMIEKALLPINVKFSQKELNAMMHFLQSSNIKTVHLLHVISEGLESKDRIQKYLEEVAQTLPTDIKINLEVREGHIATKIAQTANDIDTDLVYIMSNRRGFMYQTFLGSTSRDLLRLTDKPVLVHKTRPSLLSGETIDKILYATDFGPTAQKALQYIKKAAQFAGELYVLHVGSRAPDPFEEKKRQQEVNEKLENIEKELENYFGYIEPISTVGTPHKAIQKTSEEKKVDVIVLGRLSRAGPENILGTTSERVSGCARSSILLIP